MIKYWRKVAAALYTLLGGFYLLVALRPARYRAVILPIGILHLALVAIFLTNGLMLHIDSIPLYIDTAFCLCLGIGIGIITVNAKIRGRLRAMPA